MCIKLANLSCKLTYLTPIEKHILLILCNLADSTTHHFWCSIEKLAFVSSWSINTVEKTMKSLRDKNLIVYTGKNYDKSRIPIYKMNIPNNPTAWGDSKFITPPQGDHDPTTWGDHDPTTWDIDSVLKDYKKGIESLTQQEKQTLWGYIKFKDCEMTKELWEKVTGKKLI